MKRNKKRWTWTKKQIRNTTKGRRHWGRTAPTWYCKLHNKSYKTKTKNSLHKVMLGYDVNFLEFGRTNHRHGASWDWR